LRPCAFTDSVGPGRWPGVAVTCRECCTSNCRTVRRFPISAVRRCAAGFLFAPSLVLTVRLSHRPLISSKEGTKQGLRSHSIIISTRQANFSRNIITESRSGTKEVVFAPPPRQRYHLLRVQWQTSREYSLNCCILLKYILEV